MPGVGFSKLEELAKLAGEPPTSDPKVRLFRTSVGFEKNPWCGIYTGVSAKTTPKMQIKTILK